MSNQLVYVGHIEYLDKSDLNHWSETTKIYKKKHLAVNNTPFEAKWGDFSRYSEVREYELVPTGRKFNKQGKLIE